MTPDEKPILGSATREPFRGSAAVREERVTKARLRGPSFVRLSNDVYVGADVVIDLDVKRKALSVWGGPTAVVAGSLAADAHHVETVDDQAELVLPGGFRTPPPGVLFRADQLPEDEVTVVSGLRLTTPVRTGFDLARRLPLVDGVAMADALGRRHRFGPEALKAMARSHPHGRHLTRVKAVADLMDRQAESLAESRTRLALILRGVPRPVLQHRVNTAIGPFRLDMAWPELKVAVEYDGEHHRSISRHGRDLDRDAALADLGWIVVRVTKTQLDDSDALAARVLMKLASRSGRNQLRR